LNYQKNYENAQLIAGILKFFVVLLIIFETPTKLFSELYLTGLEW